MCDAEWGQIRKWIRSTKHCTNEQTSQNSDVFFWTSKNINCVIKCMPLTHKACLPQNFMKLRCLSRFDAEPFMEVKMLQQVNKCSEFCPHFVKMYKWELERGYTAVNPNISGPIFSRNFIFVYLQRAHGNLYDLSRHTVISDVRYMIMMFQILFALRTLHTTIGFVHGDAHIGNMLYTTHHVIPSCTLYEVDGGHYFLPDQGEHWFVSDFGRSRYIDYTSNNQDHEWADTPGLEFENFFTSLLTHTTPSKDIKSKIHAALLLLKTSDSKHKVEIFPCLFKDVFAFVQGKINPKYFKI